ncbi:MAG: hypothetical protein ACFFEY_03765 [Candidatus Thorarchaeota archaeon]
MAKPLAEDIFYDNQQNRSEKIVGKIIDRKKYLKIWKINPSFKDINNQTSFAKTISLFLIVLVIFILSYATFQNLFNSIIIGFMSLTVFIVVFHEEFYHLKFGIFSKIRFNPFEDFMFWYEKDHASTLYITNKKDLVNNAIQIFQITVIPENVRSAIKMFIKSLSSREIRLTYTYQIIQRPVIPLFKNKTRQEGLNSLKSKVTYVYFMVSYSSKGILTRSKVDRIKYHIKSFSDNMKSNFISNFHHFQVKILSGEALLNAICTFFVKNKEEKGITSNKEKKLDLNNNLWILAKFSLVTVFLIFFDFILISFKTNFLYIIGFNFLFSISIIIIWWRSILFQFTKRKVLSKKEIIISNPFKDARFYYFKKYPYSIFIHIGKRVLIGMRMINLKYLNQNPSCLLGRLIESLNSHDISFSYTLRNKPLYPYEVDKKGEKDLTERTHNLIYLNEKTRLKNEADWERWLGYRFGMWYTWLTMSINEYRYVDNIYNFNFQELEYDLLRQINVLKGAFNSNFQGYKIDDIKSNKLISGIIFSCIKDNKFRLNGSHLNYIMLQGANLCHLTDVVPILRKGLPTKIAAEFNTPLYLDNFLSIGHTFNTEILETEVPVGFTLDQIKNLLILNGESNKRDAIAMQIVSELIKAKKPSLIFDFNGKWSKMLNYFKNTLYEKDILYFKYRNAFIIDPLKSDIPYDQNNTEYLEYVLDAFSLALKKDERTVEMFRTILQRHPDMDLGSIRMSLQNQADWEKNPISDTLLTIFSDFTQEDLTFFQQESIIPNSFVQNNKTIIIDLSTLRDLNKKSFLAFIIIAKIVHYITYTTDFEKKVIVMPYVDIFFDSYYLNLNRTYDKIDIFLKPLVEKGFGIVFSANQVHYLHMNFLLYFNNYITLKTSDNRDISLLRNLMNLQEIEGSGVYTRSRKQTYQLQYLKNLNDNTVLVSRDDIDQPFPAIIDWDKIQCQPLMFYDEIVQFMKTQGFDLKRNERKILERAKKTIFEIDLGHYFIYVQEIISFLDEVKTVDQIGNLYRHKLEQQLKQILYPVISQKTNKKEQMKRIRDEILNILIRQGYLVENHQQRASGSETLRTSYSVGERYQEALQDYFETKGEAQSHINPRFIEYVSDSDSVLEKVFTTEPRKYIIPKKDLKQAFMRELSDFHYDLFNAYLYIKQEDYDNALKIENELIKKYLINVYRQYYNVEDIFLVDLNKFLTVLEEVKTFPFTKKELIGFIDKFQLIKEKENLEAVTKDLYQNISNFFMKIQNFVFQEDNNE